jgi:hypothetical protein
VLELELLPGDVALGGIPPGGVPLVLELLFAGPLALLLLFPGFATSFALFACLIGPLLEFVLELAELLSLLDAPGVELLAAGGVAVLEGLPSCQAYGVELLFGFEPLLRRVPFEATLGSSFRAVVRRVPFGATLGLSIGAAFRGVPFGATLGLPFGVVFRGVPFGATLGFRLSGVTPPPGIERVPGASGGVTPGGDEFDGVVVAGDLLVDGATTEGDDDGEDGADDDEPGGAAPVALAAARPSAAATTTVCNLSMLLPFDGGHPRNSQDRCPVPLEVAAGGATVWNRSTGRAFGGRPIEGGTNSGGDFEDGDASRLQDPVHEDEHVVGHEKPHDAHQSGSYVRVRPHRAPDRRCHEPT